ncbi:hypothetical protein H257_12754 [Aphanomyces astaci]|uniref:Uncharacterized protein n=1 Tax=Aphanomyces astaci TaxID=112090 RepID=W4FWP9_APHAT|nr:hypothetical protein H257_12754 [Aphanomyces astaci]ETV71917.1 hypothetical protein H257_12754 [Aphanomyces astaci]|eukprot:XP_009838360.1 hypothetical protein H257_12754 [Aphanomyces astaci]
MAGQPTGRELSYAKKMEASLLVEQSHSLPPNSTSTEPPSPVVSAGRRYTHRTRTVAIATLDNALHKRFSVVALASSLCCPTTTRQNVSHFAVRTFIPAVLSARDTPTSGPPEAPVFDDMWDLVHLDEKCFNAERNMRKVYLTESEEHEQRTWSSKRFIPKVMILAAVARPRHDDERGTNFDGKIGMWPIVQYLPAVLNSRNRPTGTIMPTLVNVDTVVYSDYVITRVIPSIKATAVVFNWCPQWKQVIPSPPIR